MLAVGLQAGRMAVGAVGFVPVSVLFFLLASAVLHLCWC